MIPVVLTPRPLAQPATLLQPAGRTVRAMLVDAVAQGRVEAKYLGRGELHIDGVIIPHDEALDHVLAEGQIVNLVVYPHGGGGGGGKDVGQILLQVAVIAVSMWVGGGAGGAITSQLFARVAAAAVMVAGNMAISAIYAPKPVPAEKANDRYALQSASNSYRQWGMAPLILGPCVIAPDLAVKTFTRAIGDDVWIYGILAHHYGPCQLDELKIGDTLVSSMGAGDVQFVHHLTPGPRTFTLVPNDIDQLDLAPEELTATTSAATPVVRASASEGEKFELDFYLPGGLYFQKDDGRKIAASVTITVRYRKVDEFGDPVGSGAWTNGLTIPLTGSSKDPLRITRSLSLSMGRYEFEVKRSVLEDNNEKRHTDVAWSAIRAIAFRKPVTDEVLSISEFAIRATALNQGSLAPITCKVTPLCSTWTGTEWGPAVPTANPAALTRWLLTGPAPAKPLLTSQADEGLRAWSLLCDEYEWEAHVPIMDDRTQAEAIALLERAGRAGVFWDGTQVVASPWVEKPVPKQMFTGVNLKDHRFEIAYADPVHAFRVEFQNLEQRGEADEIMVYNDGYAEFAGVDGDGQPVAAATLVEALRLEDGQKTPERAYRDARWELGRRKHQRRFDTWSADVEAVVCRYGDRVRLAWSRAGGEGGARVRARRWSAGDGSTVTGLRLDREIEMTPGVDYVVDLRLVDQLLTGVPVVNVATDAPVMTREIVFVDARTAALSPRRGDMVAFGPVEQVTEDVEILGLEPGEGLTANLTGVRYVAPLLMEGETGPIPELQTRLTLDRRKDPPAPVLLGVQASIDGVRVGFSMPPWKGSPLTGFTVRWRAKPGPGETIGWTPLPDLGAGSMILTTPPLEELPGEDDVTRVEIEVRAMTAAGQTSDPMTVNASLSVVADPLADDWSVVVRPGSADGSQQPGLIITGAVTALRAATVLIEWNTANDWPGAQAYYGPPSTQDVRIDGLDPASSVWVAFTYLSPGGVPSQRMVKGPFTVPALVAGDVSATSPTIAQIDADIAALFGDVFDVSEDLSDARSTLDAQGVEIAAARGGQANLNARIVQVNQARIDGDTSNATAISGLLSRTDLTESDILDLEIALATQTASSAEAISQVSARQAAPVNEFDGSDTSQGLKAVQRRWNGPDNVPLGLGVNENGSFAIYKTGVGQSFGSDTVLGSVSLSGGPFNLLSGAPGAWRVFSGERIGVALEITSASGTPVSILCEARYYNNAGVLVSTLASFRHTYGAPGFSRVGKVFNAPGDGYIQIEAYLIRQGYSAGATVFADTAIRRMTFARLPADWPETLIPAYAAPGNGVLSAQVTQHSASIIDLELEAAMASYEVVASASGGEPAILRLVSSTAGGYAVLAGPKVVLGTLDGSALIEVLSIYGTKARFSGNVEIDGNLTLDGTLNGKKAIVKDTVMPVYATFTAGAISIANGGQTTTTLQEVVIASEGSDILVDFNAFVNLRHDPAGSFDLTLELRRASVSGPATDYQVVPLNITAEGGGNDSVRGMFPMRVKDRPAVGTWRYYVIARTTVDNLTINEIRHRSMTAMVLLTNT